MSTNEIYPNPTVKQVIFQIRFPNLFYIESKIGDLQLKIMQEFPESRLVHRRSVVFADLGPDVKLVDVTEDIKGEPLQKIWEFKSPKNVRLNVLSDSLDITSEHHKTYNIGDVDKFRDVIEFVVDRFLSVTNIPVISRIGLRYIDECPMPPNKDNNSFKEFYNSAFPLNRFDLADAKEMATVALVKKGEYFMRYMERLVKIEDDWKLILDFDGIAQAVPKDNYLTVTDSLHEIISNEFHKTIREPVREYMRQRKE